MTKKNEVINRLTAIISNRALEAHEAGQLNYPMPEKCKQENLKKLIALEIAKLN